MTLWTYSNIFFNKVWREIFFKSQFKKWWIFKWDLSLGYSKGPIKISHKLRAGSSFLKNQKQELSVGKEAEKLEVSDIAAGI